MERNRESTRKVKPPKFTRFFFFHVPFFFFCPSMTRFLALLCNLYYYYYYSCVLRVFFFKQISADKNTFHRWSSGSGAGGGGGGGKGHAVIVRSTSSSFAQSAVLAFFVCVCFSFDTSSSPTHLVHCVFFLSLWLYGNHYVQACWLLLFRLPPSLLFYWHVFLFCFFFLDSVFCFKVSKKRLIDVVCSAVLTATYIVFFFFYHLPLAGNSDLLCFLNCHVSSICFFFFFSVIIFAAPPPSPHVRVFFFSPSLFHSFIDFFLFW